MTAFRPWPGFRPGLLPVIVFFVFLLAAPRAADAASIAGRVVDPAGRPVSGATVLVDGPLGVRTVATDADGRFAIGDLAEAVYRVLVEADGLSAPVTTVRPGPAAAALEIRLTVTPIAESVVVSAAPVPLPRSESPAATAVVDAGTLRARQLESVADALRVTPGFAVGRNGGRGALTSVFPRGGESDYTLVLVDGIRVNSFGGGFDFSLLPLGDVERVEIVRGPQSAVFGADAIGGVVHLTTRRGGGPTASAQVEGGGEATMSLQASARTTAGAWAFGASGERSRSDGFTGLAPATGETVSNDDWRQALAQAHVGWTRGAIAVGADVRWIDGERGNPGPFGSNPIGAYTAIDRVARGEDTQRQASLHGRIPWGARLAARVQQRWQVTFADLDNRYHAGFGDSFFETRRTSARTQTDVALTATTGVTAGIEGFGERARSTYITGTASRQVPIERRSLGAFAEVRQDLGARASLTAGVRVDDIRRAALDGDPNPFAPRPPFPSSAETTVNPRLAGRLVVWTDNAGVARTTVRAAYGTGMRPPDAFEIAFTDNPALAPERSRSADAGVMHVVTPRLVVEATAFLNRYDDLIVAVGRSFADASRYRTDNISNARAAGLELEGTWRGPRGVTARGAYTWLSTRIQAVDRSDAAPPPFAVGDPLVRRPRHQGALDLGWTGGALTAFATARARHEVLDIEPSYGAFGGLFTAPGFAVVDAGGSWRVRPQIEVFARALNLLNERYEEAFGYPAPGRLGMVGVRVDLRP